MPLDPSVAPRTIRSWLASVGDASPDVYLKDEEAVVVDAYLHPTNHLLRTVKFAASEKARDFFEQEGRDRIA